MSQKVKENQGKVLVSTDALCEILGVSRMAIKKWSDDGCPKETRGWWCLADVLRWRGLVGTTGVKTPGQVKELTLNEKKMQFEVQLKEAQAEMAEIKNDIAKGNYIKRDEIVTTLSRYHTVLKRSLISLGKKLSSEVGVFVDSIAARRIESQIDETVYDALSQLSVEGVYEAPKEKTIKG